MALLPAVIMIATFLLGIVPATLLMMGAVFLGVGALVSLADAALDPSIVKDGFHAVLIVLAFAVPVPVMAGFGLVGLFYAAGGQVTTRVARWLVAGMVANAAGIGFIARFLQWSWDDEGLFVLAPIVVAGAHLCWFVRSRYRNASV